MNAWDSLSIFTPSLIWHRKKKNTSNFPYWCKSKLWNPSNKFKNTHHAHNHFFFKCTIPKVKWEKWAMVFFIHSTIFFFGCCMNVGYTRNIISLQHGKITFFDPAFFLCQIHAWKMFHKNMILCKIRVALFCRCLCPHNRNGGKKSVFFFETFQAIKWHKNYRKKR